MPLPAAIRFRKGPEKAMRKSWKHTVAFEDFQVVSTTPIQAEANKRALSPDVYEYEINLRWEEAAAKVDDAEMAVLFHMPCVDVQYMWHPDSRARRVLDADWRLNIHSMLTGSAPVAMLFNGAGENTYTFATSEVRKITSVEFGVADGSNEVAGKIAMGLKQFEGTDHTTLRIHADFRRIPCHQALDTVRAWWEKVLNITPMEVPAVARTPMYSSWYNFHQDIQADALVAECRLAKKLGMDTIIVDDGWQTADGGGGYGYTGDWAAYEGKFPDMRAFVDNVHAIGMKVMLWYSVPFMGYFAKNWAQFKDMILLREDRNNTGILDPRYPEVRAFLKDVYISALKAYDLDGFKLDFIDRFKKPENDTIQPGMDYECVQEATDHMMTEIMESLRAIKPDIMIEFRQRYIGPCMRQFGNVFRVSDCPVDITTNRVGIVDLRMLSGNTAVHSDMVTWNNAEKTEDAALQILNTLFGVTQLSKLIRDMTPEHLKMTAFWLNFQRENQRVLQQSALIPYEPHYLYPVIAARDEAEEIIGVYADNKVVEPNLALRRSQLVNASWQPKLLLRMGETVLVQLTTYDCMGQLVGTEERQFTVGIHEIAVPRSGLAVMEKVEERP